MFQQAQIFQNKNEAPKATKEIDAFTGGLRELFFIDHPEYKKGMAEAEALCQKFLLQNQIKGVWIYYQSADTLIHSLPEQEYYKLRTARNHDIITEQEQTNYRNINVGIAGLSVGSSILSALVISGGPRFFKIADFDDIEISNLNRIRASLADVGRNKTEVAAREVWAVDPFAQLKLYSEGLNKFSLEEFLLGHPKLEVFVDAMDSIDLKVKARLICRKEKIPVLSVTDNGDSIILDVERFDLEPEREIFHGLIKGIEQTNLEHQDYKSWLKLATRIVDPKYLTNAMQESLLKIGKTLASVPQLGTSAAIGGSACSFAIRRIANKQPFISGRYVISLEEKLIPGFNDKEKVNEREQRAERFLQSFDQK